jgi:hypothetical protein
VTAPNAEPLDASWTIAFDEEGNDLALAAQLAAMTSEQRAESESNWRAAVEEARANLRPRAKCDDTRSV